LLQAVGWQGFDCKKWLLLDFLAIFGLISAFAALSTGISTLGAEEPNLITVYAH
jgi:hypothetical protein